MTPGRRDCRLLFFKLQLLVLQCRWTSSPTLLLWVCGDHHIITSSLLCDLHPPQQRQQKYQPAIILMSRCLGECVSNNCIVLFPAGMGDICSAWVTGRQGGPESTASLDTPDTTHHHQHNTPQTPHSTHPSTPLQQNLLQGARRESGVKFSAALHPGVVQKAERFVAAAQLKLASSLPREVLGRLRIVVQIHTEIDVSATGCTKCSMILLPIRYCTECWKAALVEQLH